MTDVPLFISSRQFVGRRRMPRARGPIGVDSRGFTELSLYGKWTIEPPEFSKEIRRIVDEVGLVDFAAPQDWMCEPQMLAKTGLSIAEHQKRTIRSVLELRALEPAVPWIPVLQGWSKDDYVNHVEQYADAGVDLSAERLVGLGSVCRRQGTGEFASIVRALSCGLGINLHGFGVKAAGIDRTGELLASADSMAWSFRARRIGAPGLAECVGGSHKNCANCLPFALAWRERLLMKLAGSWSPVSVDTFSKQPILQTEMPW